MIELAETFTDKTIEIRMRTILGMTSENHVDQLKLKGSVRNDKEKSKANPFLFALLRLNSQQLVESFLTIEGIHDGQIDHPAQINEIRLRTVFNTLFLEDG